MNTVYTLISYPFLTFISIRLHLHLGLPSSLFSSAFLTKKLRLFLVSPVRATCLLETNSNSSCQNFSASYEHRIFISVFKKTSRPYTECHEYSLHPHILPILLTFISIWLHLHLGLPGSLFFSPGLQRKFCTHFLSSNAHYILRSFVLFSSSFSRLVPLRSTTHLTNWNIW
jgi:hypothetical protein